ncbi:hypothetical protein FRB94_008340 [Tulasnella sp. JGI-2019a]|nr:hypothetical protein FRB93_002345 [Tulasnella sp. JGI-2019a]KAG8996424.1 hypothetical protein FRB94_008340 [Tulasnella sp. JGI-2019a]
MDIDTDRTGENGKGALPPSEATSSIVTFEPASCPIAWPATQGGSIHINYPFSGIDTESQAAEEYATRKYVETLWLPNSVFPLENFVRDLQRLVAIENQSSTTPIFLYKLVQHILLDRKAVTAKYTCTLPEVLEVDGAPENEEERMVLYAKTLERKPTKDKGVWLERFHCREYQIQILLRMLLLLYPLPSTSLSQKSHKKKRKPEISLEQIENSLMSLLCGLVALAESNTSVTWSGDANEGWVGQFCEEVIGPIFQAKLPDIYDMCLLNLCPSKYQSPPSSPTSSPGPSNSLLPNPELEGTRQQLRKSRSPSLAPSEVSILDAPSRGGSVVREFSRARSGSLLSEEVAARAKVSRGGVATSHSMFARQVDMRKSAQAQEPLKGKEKMRHRSSNGNDKAPSTPIGVSSKRQFARATTLPIKPLVASKPIMLVAATPATNRTRSMSMETELQDSPDALRFSPEYEESKDNRRNVLVPDTPMKC